MSFPFGTIPATGIFVGFIGYSATTNVGALGQAVFFRNEKVTIPVITFFNPVNANAQMFDLTISADCTNTKVYVSGPVMGISTSLFVPECDSARLADAVAFHYTADSRLGV